MIGLNCTLKGTRMKIADFVKAKRTAMALTQPQLALQAGVGLRFLRELERGKPSVQLDKVNQVLQVFGVEVGVLTAAGSNQVLPADESVATLKGPISKTKSAQKTTQRPNVLVLCGRNKKRSRTAEAIFKNDARFGIRSAGLSAKSDRKVTENDLRWADLVLVMEHKQRGKLHSQFPGHGLPPVEVLQVADEYAFMESALVDILTEKINWQLKVYFKI